MLLLRLLLTLLMLLSQMLVSDPDAAHFGEELRYRIVVGRILPGLS